MRAQTQPGNSRRRPWPISCSARGLGRLRLPTSPIHLSGNFTVDRGVLLQSAIPATLPSPSRITGCFPTSQPCISSSRPAKPQPMHDERGRARFLRREGGSYSVCRILQRLQRFHSPTAAYAVVGPSLADQPSSSAHSCQYLHRGGELTTSSRHRCCQYVIHPRHQLGRRPAASSRGPFSTGPGRNTWSTAWTEPGPSPSRMWC